ncbi:MAG: hypothetical protein ACREJ3_08675, partial [Polyangiaceae bacterium]
MYVRVNAPTVSVLDVLPRIPVRIPQLPVLDPELAPLDPEPAPLDPELDPEPPSSEVDPALAPDEEPDVSEPVLDDPVLEAPELMDPALEAPDDPLVPRLLGGAELPELPHAPSATHDAKKKRTVQGRTLTAECSSGSRQRTSCGSLAGARRMRFSARVWRVWQRTSCGSLAGARCM